VDVYRLIVSTPFSSSTIFSKPLTCDSLLHAIEQMTVIGFLIIIILISTSVSTQM